MPPTATLNAHPQHLEPKSKITWIPIAAFAGVTVALAVPLVLLARQRGNALRYALKESPAPPPRRAGSIPVVHISRNRSLISSEPASIRAPSAEDSPRVGELVSAISKADINTTLYAGKAFVIATSIVTVGGLALAYGVKMVMGVKDTQDFAQRMRLAIWKHLPTLSARIRRPPETDDEGSSLVSSSEVDPDWNWEDAEKRLQAAYDNGGFPEWIHVAVKEMHVEMQIETAKRRRELEKEEKQATA